MEDDGLWRRMVYGGWFMEDDGLRRRAVAARWVAPPVTGPVIPIHHPPYTIPDKPTGLSVIPIHHPPYTIPYKPTGLSVIPIHHPPYAISYEPTGFMEDYGGWLMGMTGLSGVLSRLGG
jgi:hypothetical protein